MRVTQRIIAGSKSESTSASFVEADKTDGDVCGDTTTGLLGVGMGDGSRIVSSSGDARVSLMIGVASLISGSWWGVVVRLSVRLRRSSEPGVSDVKTRPPSCLPEFEYGADRGALRLLRFGVPSHESGDGVTVWGSTFVPTSGDAKSQAFDRLFNFRAFRRARRFCAGASPCHGRAHRPDRALLATWRTCCALRPVSVASRRVVSFDGYGTRLRLILGSHRRSRAWSLAACWRRFLRRLR